MEPIVAQLEKYNDNEYNLKITGDYSADAPEKLIIKPIGNIEAYNTQIFSKAVFDTLKEYKQIKNITIDLKRVPYMSSTGIGVIMQVLGYSNKNKLSLALKNVNEKIHGTLNLLGLNTFFDL